MLGDSFLQRIAVKGLRHKKNLPLFCFAQVQHPKEIEGWRQRHVVRIFPEIPRRIHKEIFRIKKCGGCSEDSVTNLLRIIQITNFKRNFSKKPRRNSRGNYGTIKEAIHGWNTKGILSRI